MKSYTLPDWYVITKISLYFMFGWIEWYIGYNIEHMTSLGTDLSVIVYIFLDAMKCTP